MNRPRRGSVAKACTDAQHAGAHEEGAQQRQREGHDRQQHGPVLEAAALLGDASEWISAVPTSQGMKEAFSTGSQNHQPPQPSS